LAIVRQVADQQGGRIGAEPAPGGGTLMRLRFARAERVDPGAEDLHGGDTRSAAADRDLVAGAGSTPEPEPTAPALAGRERNRS
jgi:hypothetical protein